MLSSTIGFTTNPLTVSASDEIITPNPNDPPPLPNTPSPRIPIERKAYNQNSQDGIIMIDNPVIPRSWDQAFNMAKNPPGTHTGWSTVGETKVCQVERIAIGYDGKPVTPDKPYPQTSDKIWWWKDDWSGTYYHKWDSNPHSTKSFQFNTNNKFDEGPLDAYKDQLNAKYNNLIKEHGIKSWDGVRGLLNGDGKYWSKYTTSGSEMKQCTSHGEEQRSWSYGDNEIVMVGWIQADREYPGGSHESGGTNDGDVKGNVYWELVRHNENANSGVDGFVDLKVSGKHYATRNVKQTAKLGNDSKTAGRDQSMKLHVPDGMTVKDDVLSYGITYEYTNFYEDKYKCEDQNGPYCYEWHFVERVPDWTKAKTFNYNESIKINHQMLETFTGGKIEYSGLQQCEFLCELHYFLLAVEVSHQM